MNSILKKITDQIKADYQQSFENFSLRAAETAQREKPVDILPLLKSRFFVIAEIKKGSPSRGIIRESLDPVQLATAYEKGGASAISVVTESNFFFGEKSNLTLVKKTVKLPVLRKDFLVHPYQIYESYNMGADFILLIVACLEDKELKELHALALTLGMSALVEIHSEEELERALKIKPTLLGINNRNLKTFEVDLETSYRLRRKIPDDIFLISESGIRSHDDIIRLRESGFSGALIGEALLKEKDARGALRRLING